MATALYIRPFLALFFLLAISSSSIRAGTTLGPWTPNFKGIDHAVGTNTPGDGGFSSLQVAHFFRIDLKDPDISLFTTPPAPDPIQGRRETVPSIVSDFLSANQLQVAINANFFNPDNRSIVFGLAISEGTVVSVQESSRYASTLLFDQLKNPTFIPTNWPAVSNAQFFTAVSGFFPLLIDGTNVGGRFDSHPDLGGLNPRTAMGISQDNRYLYLLAIDGRQPNYSNGARCSETAAWMLLAGAHNAINLDGGASVTLAMEDYTGSPTLLTKPSAGYERLISSHFGVRALPFSKIPDAEVLVEADTAVIKWQTPLPVVGQAHWGPTEADTASIARESAALTNHTVLVTGLKANTTYFYRISSVTDNGIQISTAKTFTTTNGVARSPVFDLQTQWKFTTNKLDGIPWATPSFDDSSWSEGPGLLWADTRLAGPAPGVEPKATNLPTNDSTGFPYRTYYFRKRFSYSEQVKNASLYFSAKIDDGAVVYLNGKEVYRLRMGTGLVDYVRPANGTPCSNGNAICLEQFEIKPPLATNLVNGENVIAVEVHNYSATDYDITFGLSLEQARPAFNPPLLLSRVANGIVTITWDRLGFTLQESMAIDGPWLNVPGPIFLSPFTAPAGDSQKYYRLKK